MPTNEESLLGSTEQERLDQRLNEQLPGGTRKGAIKKLLKQAKELDVDPATLAALEKESQ